MDDDREMMDADRDLVGRANVCVFVCLCVYVRANNVRCERAELAETVKEQKQGEEREREKLLQYALCMYFLRDGSGSLSVSSVHHTSAHTNITGIEIERNRVSRTQSFLVRAPPSFVS